MFQNFNLKTKDEEGSLIQSFAPKALYIYIYLFINYLINENLIIIIIKYCLSDNANSKSSIPLAYSGWPLIEVPGWPLVMSAFTCAYDQKFKGLLFFCFSFLLFIYFNIRIAFLIFITVIEFEIPFILKTI